MSTAEGPGTAVTLIPASIAAAVTRNPGSDTLGMPASVATRTVCPARSASSSSPVRLASLPSKYDTTRAAGSTPRRRHRSRRRRVSSAAITSASASARTSAGLASAASPIGVPASTSSPASVVVTDPVCPIA